MAKKTAWARAIRVYFKLSEVLPPANPVSVSVVRLLMAVNDARHIHKLLLSANWVKAKPGSAENSVRSGEILHLFRLLCAHLYEAGVAFRSVPHEVLNECVRDRGDAQVQLAYVRKSFATDSDGAFHYAYLKPIRDAMGFHYKKEPLGTALVDEVARGELQGVLIICDNQGLSRYSIGDHLANTELMNIFGVGPGEYPGEFQKHMHEVINLANSLSTVVDRLLFNIVSSRRHGIITSEEVLLSIPPAVRAKKKRQSQ